MIACRELNADEIDRSAFASFDRTQQVTKRRRKLDGRWTVEDVAFVDNWSDAEYHARVLELKQIAASGGYVAGAFDNGVLKGFVAVSPARFGTRAQYLDLTSLHVSRDLRGQGIGRRLFALAADWARERHAEKLYISAHSAVESQAFYQALGCVEALEYDGGHAEAEPFDCQMEYVL